MPDNLTCPRCKKDLTKACRLISPEAAFALHERAHAREDVATAFKTLYAVKKVLDSGRACGTCINRIQDIFDGSVKEVLSFNKRVF